MQNYQKLLLFTLFFTNVTVQAMELKQQHAGTGMVRSLTTLVDTKIDFALFPAMFIKSEGKIAPEKLLGTTQNRQGNKQVITPAHIFEFNNQEVVIKNKEQDVLHQWKKPTLTIVPSIDQECVAILDEKNILFLNNQLQAKKASLEENSIDTFHDIFALPNGTFVTVSILGIQTWDPATAKNINRISAPYIKTLILGPQNTLFAHLTTGGISRYDAAIKKKNFVPLLPASPKATLRHLPGSQALQIINEKQVVTYTLNPDAVDALQGISTDSLAQLKKLIAQHTEQQQKLIAAGSKVAIELTQDDAAFFATLPASVQACLKSNFNVKL